MSNSLNPDHIQHFVSPGLGLNCLQRKAEDTSGDSGLPRTCRVFNIGLDKQTF